MLWKRHIIHILISAVLIDLNRRHTRAAFQILDQFRVIEIIVNNAFLSIDLKASIILILLRLGRATVTFENPDFHNITKSYNLYI